MKKTPALLFAAPLLLSACASLTTPSAERIAELPVVRYGQPAPADGEYVLLYPAGVDLPVHASIDGTLLEKADRATLTVRVKQDLYTFRDLVSFDGTEWSRSTSKVGGRIWFTVPGRKDGNKADSLAPGEIGMVFDLKQ